MAEFRYASAMKPLSGGQLSRFAACLATLGSLGMPDYFDDSSANWGCTDTVYEQEKERFSRLLDQHGNPIRYALPRIGFDLRPRPKKETRNG